MEENKNITLNRRAEILKKIESEGQVEVVALSNQFYVSLVTIRKDLAHLEKKGLLIKTRGGAIKSQPTNFDLGFNQKLKKNYKEKQRIGKKAVDLINDGDSILFDSGTTTLEIAKNITHIKNLTVITNSLPIAEYLSDKDNIDLILLGGKLRSEMRSLVGSLAEESLKKLFCDKAFLAVDGVDYQTGIYTPNIEEAALGRVMIEQSKKVIIVTDSSKFSKYSLSLISKIEAIDYLITDNNIPHDQKKGLIQKGVELIIA